MDAMEWLDWGAYSHFGYTVSKRPDILPFMEPAYHLGSSIGTATILLSAILLFLFQRQFRSALVAMIGFGVGVGLVQIVSLVVARRRPHDAQNWVGADRMLGSYPAPDVFLFLLSAVLLGFAVWDWTRGPYSRMNLAARVLYPLLATAISVWVCMSQFLLGTHFVTDVIGAIAGVGLVSWCVYLCLPATDSPPAN